MPAAASEIFCSSSTMDVAEKGVVPKKERKRIANTAERVRNSGCECTVQRLRALKQLNSYKGQAKVLEQELKSILSRLEGSEPQLKRTVQLQCDMDAMDKLLASEESKIAANPLEASRNGNDILESQTDSDLVGAPENSGLTFGVPNTEPKLPPLPGARKASKLTGTEPKPGLRMQHTEPGFVLAAFTLPPELPASSLHSLELFFLQFPVGGKESWHLIKSVPVISLNTTFRLKLPPAIPNSRYYFTVRPVSTDGRLGIQSEIKLV